MAGDAVYVGLLRFDNWLWFACSLCGFLIFAVSAIYWLNHRLNRPVGFLVLAVTLALAIPSLGHVGCLERIDISPTRVTTLSDLRKWMHGDVAQQQRAVVYYFHADWCVECPEFERDVLRHPELAEFWPLVHLVFVDVTEFEPYQALLYQDFGIAGLPSLAFQDKNRKILPVHFTGTNVSRRAVREVLSILCLKK